MVTPSSKFAHLVDVFIPSDLQHIQWRHLWKTKSHIWNLQLAMHRLCTSFFVPISFHYTYINLSPIINTPNTVLCLSMSSSDSDLVIDFGSAFSIAGIFCMSKQSGILQWTSLSIFVCRFHGCSPQLQCVGL